MSYTFNTLNPIGANGSADARDLVDNAQVADRLINGTDPVVPDRLGVSRKSWHGIEQDFSGYVSRGLWTSGADYLVNEIWQNGSGGEYYQVITAYTSGASAAADIAGGNVALFQARLASDADVLAGTAGKVPDAAQLKGNYIGVSRSGYQLLVPSDFPSLQSAFDYISHSELQPDLTIDVHIESGHALSSGLNLRHGDWSRVTITSDDATVYLSGSFVGADTSGIPAGILGEAPAAPLFLGFGAKMPKLACKIDMENLHGTGVQLAESEMIINDDCGVINAGFRGIQIHGRANGYGSVWDGASGSGIRLQQASSGCFNGASADNCCSTADVSNSAVYVSRSSSLEFRYGHANNSGASGLISRRSKVTADNASFDGAAINGIYCESEAEVSFSMGSAINCVGSSLRSSSNASIYAVGATISTSSAAKNLNIDVGSRITVAGSTTIEGSSGLANAISESTVSYANAWSPAGVLIYDGETGTFETGTGTNGTYQKTADGRMTAWVNATINVGTVASGGTSAPITLPTLPVTFATVDTAHMTVVGRTSINGGGNRVGVTNYWRGHTTGNEWRIVNSGVQLDGSSTGLNCLSIQVQMTIHGTY